MVQGSHFCIGIPISTRFTNQETLSSAPCFLLGYDLPTQRLTVGDEHGHENNDIRVVALGQVRLIGRLASPDTERHLTGAATTN